MKRPTIITVLKGYRQGQKYMCTVNASALEYYNTDIHAGGTPEEAAARAMECAAKWGGSGYMIFGAPEVLECIPEPLRKEFVADDNDEN